LVDAPREDTPQIIRQLVEATIDIYEITSERQSLEDYFLAVTQEDAHDVA